MNKGNVDILLAPAHNGFFSDYTGTYAQYSL